MTQRVRAYAFLLRHAGALTATAVLGLLALSPFALQRGLVHAEAYQIIPHYLGARPALAKIFDPNGADAGCYTARELSYFFDYLDCQLIAAGVRRGWPHFLSLSHYVFCAGIAASLWFVARRRLKLHSLAAGLLVLLFATTSAVFLGGGFFRSAKAGAAGGGAVVLAILADALCDATRLRRPAARLALFVSLTLAATLMGLFDRQGFALGLLATAWLAVRAWRLRDALSLALAGSLALSVALVSFYNHVVGPLLIEHFNNYQPSLEFQHLPWRELLTSPSTAFNVAFYAPVLLLDNLRFLLGGIPLALAAGLLAAGWWFLAPRWPWPDGAPPSAAFNRAWFALVPLALLVMNGLMILRVKAMLNLDSRRVYYGLPSIVVLCFLVALAAKALSRHPGWRPRWVVVTLAVLVLCNLAGLLEHRAIIRRGLYLEQHATSAAIIEALAHLERVAPAKARPPYWPVHAGAPAEDDGLVRFFRRRQLIETGQPVPAP